MALFIKRNKPNLKLQPILLPEVPKDNLSFLNTESFKQLRSYQRQWIDAENWPAQYRVLRIWWPKVCKDEMPKINAELLHTRIAYELQACAYIEAGMEMPKGVAQNYKAAKAFKIKDMTNNMRSVMEILIKSQSQKENGMDSKKVKKAKSAEVEKVSRQSVSQFYLEIFEAQAKAGLTDEQIAAAIKEKAGQMPTLKNVASYRCMYNAGKIQGQKTVPSVKVKSVRAISEKAPKVKKPMSEETKAKLKAYSEKKKKLTIKKKK